MRWRNGEPKSSQCGANGGCKAIARGQRLLLRAELTLATAHGPGTKTGRWKKKTCPRRRSHYRHRLENNAKQRGGYRALKTAAQAVEVSEGIFIPVQAPPVALLYLFREDRQDAHLHAIAVAIWQGNRKLAEVQPVHCLGMTNRQVNEFLRNVLGVVGEKYGITEFEPPIRMEPMECPMQNRPLKASV